MKVGILTMNYAKNYGGMLQCYGLFKYITGMGHEVKVIDYKGTGKYSLSSYLSKAWSLLTKSKVHTEVTIPHRKLTDKYLQNFVDFRNRCLEYTESVNEYTISSACQQFDAIVVGSDQIWNDINSNKLVYYFDWKFEGTKIAYAPCTILSNVPLFLRSKVKKLLGDFDFLSGRDSHTIKYVESFGFQTSDLVVDPSCLYDYSDLLLDNLVGEPYILTYILGSEIKGGNKNAIDHIKKMTGNLKVVSVCIPSVSLICEEISDKVFYEASPVDWVNLFKHASFVYTDSFHGIMFSLKFQKQFVAYCKDSSRQSRLIDLRNRLGLKNIIDDASSLESLDSQSILVNYDCVNEKLNGLIRFSESFLQKALSFRRK